MEVNKLIETAFKNIQSLTSTEKCESLDLLLTSKTNSSSTNGKVAPQDVTSRPIQWQYIEKLVEAVNHLSDLIKECESVLISVKNQKLLRCCFQLITSMGILPCLIPGVGINLNKRCENASKLTAMKLDDTAKYTILKLCTDFFISCWQVPVLKNIIVSFHLADYLGALIQLSYAPLKKPGVYADFTMTQDMYDQLQCDRAKYVQIFENLVSTCFQPMLMKELLVLQSSTDPSPPLFLKRVTSQQLSKRLLAPGGLLSLIRCFIETESDGAGYEWRKIDMIRRIVGTKHGSIPEQVYLKNICTQLKQAIVLTNLHYYSTVAACILHLREKYPQSDEVEESSNQILKAFDPKYLKDNCSLPGTVILTSQEVEHKINILHSVFCSMRVNESAEIISSNFAVLFLIRLKCTKSQELKEKLDDMILKHLEESTNDSLGRNVEFVLLGSKHDGQPFKLSIEEYDSGIILKNVVEDVIHPKEESAKYLISIFKKTAISKFAAKLFQICLEILSALTKQRKHQRDRSLLSVESEYLDNLDTSYGVLLQTLEELCALSKTVSIITDNPEYIVDFIENMILQSNLDNDDECVTIALVLLNTLLSESKNVEVLKKQCSKIIPVLQKISLNDSNNSLLAKEILLMTSDAKSHNNKKSEYELVISDIFDNLLPVRAHGLIELTKLIEKKDAETLSKKHFVMCLFQEQLKDEDTYIYLSAINGIAALCLHSTEEVLNVLCKEYLGVSAVSTELETIQSNEKRAQLRMKVGDVIVKVTKGLGEMASVHKTLLLNTVLCVCRDQDPLLRASALSNVAEITLIMNYKLSTIIYEILLCIGDILETDRAQECRRAAVMVVSSLLRGLGKETLLQLGDTLLPLYRTLRKLHGDEGEDSAVRLHAQIALEELNDIVKGFVFQKVDMEKKIDISGAGKPEIKFK